MVIMKIIYIYMHIYCNFRQTSQAGRIIHPPPPSHPPPKRDQPSAAAHHQPPPPYPGRTAPPSRDPVPTTTVAPGRPRPPVKAGHVAVSSFDSFGNVLDK